MEKKRILVADDDEGVRALMVEVLEVYDYEIDAVENGVEAIKCIDNKIYDLIITDYMMPEMDGLEFTQKIKAKYPSIPILIVTATGPVQDLLKNGATACISKPFEIAELQSTIETILKKER